MYVSDSHLPKIWMICLGAPAKARADAPPWRRECVLVVSGALLDAFKTYAIWERTRNLPSLNINNGPPTLPLRIRYFVRALKGHKALNVAPTLTSTPAQKGSVLDVDKCTVMMLVPKFSVTSLTPRLRAASKEVVVGVVYSDTLSMPKNANSKAAESMSASWLGYLALIKLRVCFKWRSETGVLGGRKCDVFCVLRIPLKR